MSNALALAAVTAVIKDLLDNAMIDHSVSAAVGGSVTVSALPPDRIVTGENETPRLNLFLYQIAPNAALRNRDLPSRDDRGQRQSNPSLALNLHYLLTAYSAQDFEAEILLGYAMLMLHETPVLTRGAIRRTLAGPNSPVGGGILPPALGALAASDLAEQVEMVKLTPHALNTEELSKLWTASKANYRPSAAYLATVVLLERELPARSPLPVLSRGERDPVTGQEQGVRVLPTLLPPYPALETAAPPDGQPAVRLGELLTLAGRNLAGDAVVARFTHLRSGSTLELKPESDRTATQVVVRMPPDPPVPQVPDESPLNPSHWQAGVHSVSVTIRKTGQPDRVTNALPVTLAPRLVSIAAATGAGGVTVAVDVTPPVRRTQRVRLIVGTLEVPVTPMAGESVSTLEFTSIAYPSGPQWVRLRIDEAESVLVNRAVTPPVFDATQQVTIP